MRKIFIKKPFDEIAIKGQYNLENARKIIQVFENAGAKNTFFYNGDSIKSFYYINDKGRIKTATKVPVGYKEKTLKEVFIIYNKSGLNHLVNVVKKIVKKPMKKAVKKQKTLSPKINVPKIAIMSNGTTEHGKKIIEYLLSQGARNPLKLDGTEIGSYYFVNNAGYINKRVKQGEYKIIELPKENGATGMDERFSESPKHPYIIPNTMKPEQDGKPEFKLFNNPRNIAYSLIELERHLRPLNPPENTNEFLNAVREMYVKNSLQKAEKSPIQESDAELPPLLPNAIEIWQNWEQSGKEKVLDAISESNLHISDYEVIAYIFTAIDELKKNFAENCELRKKYFKLLSQTLPVYDPERKNVGMGINDAGQNGEGGKPEYQQENENKLKALSKEIAELRTAQKVLDCMLTATAMGEKIHYDEITNQIKIFKKRRKILGLF